MLKTRVITSLILAPLAIIGIFFLPLSYFSVFVACIAIIGAWEWANLAGFSQAVQRLAYSTLVAAVIGATSYWIQVYEQAVVIILLASFAWWCGALILVRNYPRLQSFWRARYNRAVLGLLVLVPFWAGLVQLKSYPDADLLIVYLMLTIWGADTGAYFAGRTWGKAKLAPNVSPGKSWAGVYGGIVTTGVVAAVAGVYVSLTVVQLSSLQWLQLFSITALTVCFSIVGDLVESMFKRYRGIKDSSQLIPGHGGLLDRIDSITAAAPIYALALLILGWGL